jgi:hypothetical protein
MVQDIMVDLSTAPQKELIKVRLNAYLKAQGLVTADELAALVQQGAQVPPNMLPQAPVDGASGKSAGDGGAAPKEPKETPQGNVNVNIGAPQGGTTAAQGGAPVGA